MSKKKKGKGGQSNPKKKWVDLSLKQREYAILTAAEEYIKARNELGRQLSKNEKHKLIKNMKLRLWLPTKARIIPFMNEFGRQENLIQRDRGDEK